MLIFSRESISKESTITSTSGDASPSSQSAEAHKNEGFLKAAWHKLTHQHDDIPPEEPKIEEKGQEEEPKKASGSG